MADTACSVKIPAISSAFVSKEGHEILSAMKASRYVDYVNVLFGRVFAREYIDNNSYITLSDFTDENKELTINGNLITLYNKVKEELAKDIKSDFYDGLKMEVVNDILKIHKNWDLFVDFHSNYNSFISIKEVEDLAQTEEKESFDKRGNEYTEFELISNEVRTLLKFLPKAEFVTDINGNFKIVEAYDPNDGLPIRADFENTFKLVLDVLKGIKDESRFIEALTSDDVLKRVPELEFLFKILPLKNGGLATLLDKQRLLFNSFYTTFSRDYIPVHASTRIVDTEDEKKLPVHIRYKSAKGNTEKIYRQFSSNFSLDRTETKYVQIDNTENEEHPEKSGNGRKILSSLPNKLDLISLSDEDLRNTTISKIQSRYRDYFDFLEILGVKFSDLSLLKDMKDKIDLIKILNSTRTIHDNITDRIAQGIKLYNPIEDIQEYIPKSIVNKKVVPSLSPIVKDIVKFEGQFSKITPTIMSRSASDEKQSDISFSNALSIAAGQIANSNSIEELSQKSYFKKIKYNPLSEYSYVANNIIGTSNKYTIENYSGHVLQKGEDTINSDTRSLSDVDKFKSDFSNLLGWGRINTPQLESKAGYFSLNFLDENEKGIVPFSTANFETEFLSNGSAFFKQVIGYLKGEVAKVKSYPTLKKSTYNVPESYGDLHIFRDLITNKQLEYLLNNTWDETSAIIQEIKPKLESYFKDIFDTTINFIEKNKIQDLITEQALKNQNLTEEIYKESPEAIQNLLLRTFIANDFIHNVEFGIFMSGDPLFFEKKNKDGSYKGDWHKRLGGLASTGVQPANTNNLRYLFNGDKESLFWSNYSLRGILNQTQEEPVARRDNFDTFLSAVLKENTIGSDTSYHNPKTLVDYVHSYKLKTGKDISIQEAERQLKVKDLKIDVGDGQGYLNLDAHRELSIKQDTYRPQHDVSYKYEGLIFKRDVLKRELSKDEEKLLQKLQNQIVRSPEKYALPILKQTYYGTMANEEVKLDAKVFDKFSLAPLLPSMARNHPELQRLLMAMALRQIHYVKYESGTKGYKREVFDVEDLYNEKTQLDELQSELLKLQIIPSKKEKTETKIPTQMIKLVYTNLFDKGVASSPRVAELRDKFISDLNNIQAVNKELVLDKLGFKTDKDGKITSWDKDKIIERLIQQINAQKLPSNLLEALETNSEGEFINTIESSGIYQQLLNYVTGKLDSSLREFKVNGGDFVLISESMFSTPLKYFRLSQDKSRIEPLECRVTLTKEFSKLLNLPDPNKDGQIIGSIDRLNQLLKNKDFVNKYEKELTITFSRPPVQGPNSMGVGRVVEFFSPTAGNILQLPKEFMHQAGIDFDYDKEKVLLPSLSEDGFLLNDESIQKRLTELENEHDELRDVFDYVDEYLDETEDYDDYDDLRRNLLTKDNFRKLMSAVFNTNDNDLERIPEKLLELEDKAEEYLKLKFRKLEVNNNNLLQSFISSLQVPDLFSELILPNSDAVVKPLARENGEDINNINTLPIGNSVYSYMENLKVFKMFNDAKALLGPFALHNVFSQLIAPLDIELSLDYAWDKNEIPQRRINLLLLKNRPDRSAYGSGKINISAREDNNGQNKQHLNSEFINATVDSNKDPYFANFMLSFDNINVFMFLFTLGYPVQTIIDFTSSAIVRKYIEVKDRNPGIKTEALVELTLREAGLPYKTGVSMNELMKIDASMIEEDNTELLEKLKHLKKDSSLSEEDNIKHHKALLLNFVAMEDHARQLSNFKNLFKNDTNKTTSLYEIFSKSALRKNVRNMGMFNSADISKVEDNSTITAFRNDDVIEDVLKTVFPIVSQKDVVNTLGTIFSERKPSLNDNKSRILSQVITNDFIGSILFTYGVYKDQNLFEYAKNLVRKVKNEETGEFSLTLLERVSRFRQSKEYQALSEQFPVLTKISSSISPKIIRNNAVYDNKHAFNVLFDVDPNVPLIEKENYMHQFKQLIEGDFETKDPKVREALSNMIKDFFIAGLVQSGFNKTGTSFVSYMPIRFTQELLSPALAGYNFQQTYEYENFKKFLEYFDNAFKLNNPSYFYLPSSEKRLATRSSYLGKNLRLVHFTSVDNTQSFSVPEDVNTVEVPVTEVVAPTKEVPTTINEFSYKGRTIPTEFKLGEEQTKALQDLIDFVKESEDNLITLQGAAGTGKTSIIGYLQKYLGRDYSFAYIAPTHAATAELAFATVKTGNTLLPSTLQSSLTLNAKSKKYVFSVKVLKKLPFRPVVVLDEASMIDDNDIAHLQQAIDNVGGKLIFLGDEKQISKVVTGDVMSKQVSPAFTDFKQINLNKIFRQSDNSLLNLLSAMRNQTDFHLFKVENSDSVKFVDRREYNKELIKDLQTNPENTTVISYTNSSVKAVNNSSRRVLGRDGETKKGDIIIGYLGYASKQIEKGDIANSISYTIENITPNGPAKNIIAKSSKLRRLIDMGITGISEFATTNYYQLSSEDSLTFDDLSEKDYAENNESVSKVFRTINQANIDFNNKAITYGTYLGILQGATDDLRKYSVGDDYVFNPTTDRMEKYDLRKHKNIKTNGNGSLLMNKDVDYGHAITIHKSQGATIDNVYFDSGSLKSAANTPIVDREGNKITTEKQSLAYVAMSRSKKKLVVYEADNDFEDLDPSQEQPKTVENTLENSIYSQLGDKTVSGNVEIVDWADLKEYDSPIEKDSNGNIEYVISTRIKGKFNHFGNPFSHDPAGKTAGLIKTETIKEAVEKYIDWVINSQEDRAKWIRKQLQSGELKGKPILYYKELGEPSHATALDYLINKYDWNKSTPQGINILSTDKNGYEKLSNLLNGPIVLSGFRFKTVEHLYQWKKAEFAGDEAAANAIFNAKTGWDAQKLGKTVKGLDQKAWDEVSSQVLANSMLEAFNQNATARKLLLSTGNATLTHKANFSLGKWEAEFPRILMEIRSGLQDKISSEPTKIIPSEVAVSQDEYTNHSGGAKGSDYDGWDKIGKEFGFNNHLHYYTGERSSMNAPYGNTEISESDADYQEGRFETAKAAAITYGYQYSAMKDPRLIRNWAQVKYSDAVFAIGSIVGPGEKLFPSIKDDTRAALVVAVTGGTGYAVQMAINSGKPVYVFDQNRGVWAKNIDGQWSASDTPVLTKNYAGIGTRQLNKAGEQAIRDVYQKTLDSLNNKTSEEKSELNKEIDSALQQKKDESENCNK